MDLITLRPDDNNRVSPTISQLPGVLVTPQADLLPTDDGFAPTLVDQVKKTVINQLDGQAGWRVVTVNQNGADVGILNEVPGTPAPSVSLTLDRSIQNAAQRRNLHRQVGILNRRSRPDGLHDLILRNEIAGAFDKHAEDIEGARADSNLSTVVETE